MRWSNLEDGECPICGVELKESMGYGYYCPGQPCDFKITELRYSEILKDMTGPKMKKLPISNFHDHFDENLSELNNLPR